MQSALGRMAAGRVEHIGSTAVPGLAAKPIIDMVVPVRAHAEAGAVRSALEAIGWVHDPQPDDREMRRLSFCRPDPAWRTHHLHVVAESPGPWRDWIAFRDGCASTPVAPAPMVAQGRVARRHHDDRGGLPRGKGAFVRETLLAARVHVATADAWEQMGHRHESTGGGAGEVRGLRLMASGLPLPSWNNADLTGADPDLDGACAFYAARSVPWGVRVPAGAALTRGRLDLTQRDGLGGKDLRPARARERLQLRPAQAADADLVVALDAAGFDDDPLVTRRVDRAARHSAGFDFVLAALGGDTIGTAFTLRSDGRAGSALLLGGVTVMPAARGRGVAGAMSSWCSVARLERGAEFAHLQCDTATAGRVYGRLGFAEAGELGRLHRALSHVLRLGEQVGGPALSRRSPTDWPSADGSAAGPLSSSRIQCEPSGRPTKAERVSAPPAKLALAPIGGCRTLEGRHQRSLGAQLRGCRPVGEIRRGPGGGAVVAARLEREAALAGRGHQLAHRASLGPRQAVESSLGTTMAS